MFAYRIDFGLQIGTMVIKHLNILWQPPLEKHNVLTFNISLNLQTAFSLSREYNLCCLLVGFSFSLAY